MKKTLILFLIIIWCNGLTAQTNQDSGWVKLDSTAGYYHWVWTVDSVGNFTGGSWIRDLPQPNPQQHYTLSNKYLAAQAKALINSLNRYKTNAAKNRYQPFRKGGKRGL